MSEEILHIYCDGSYGEDTGGAYAACGTYKGIIIECMGGFSRKRSLKSHDYEIQAVRLAFLMNHRLKQITGDDIQVIIYTDQKYLARNFNENRSLFKQYIGKSFLKKINKRNIDVRHCGSHPHHKRAHNLSNIARKSKIKSLKFNLDFLEDIDINK